MKRRRKQCNPPGQPIRRIGAACAAKPIESRIVRPSQPAGRLDPIELTNEPSAHLLLCYGKPRPIGDRPATSDQRVTRPFHHIGACQTIREPFGIGRKTRSTANSKWMATQQWSRRCLVTHACTACAAGVRKAFFRRPAHSVLYLSVTYSIWLLTRPSRLTHATLQPDRTRGLSVPIQGKLTGLFVPLRLNTNWHQTRRCQA